MKTAAELHKMKQKIQLLLNKAANTPYPEEAKTFQEHAERLMVRHSIDSLDGVEEETKFTTLSFTSKGQYRVVKHQGLAMLVKAFPHLTCFQTSLYGTKDKMLTVVGTSDELTKFSELVGSLEIQCTNAMADWWKTYTPMPGERDVTAKRSFMLAFYSQCAIRFHKLFREDTEAGSALVLVNNRAKEWMEQKYSLKKGRPGGARKVSGTAARAGQKAANEADLVQTKIKGQGAISL